jgi:hypothetical protein
MPNGTVALGKVSTLPGSEPGTELEPVPTNGSTNAAGSALGGAAALGKVNAAEATAAIARTVAVVRCLTGRR